MKKKTSFNLIITEELYGPSSANWIIRDSPWSKTLLHRSFEVCDSRIPLFGDQDCLIASVMLNRSLAGLYNQTALDPLVVVIPQYLINSYDSLNGYFMNGHWYSEGDLLITFPQCRDSSCNPLFSEAFDFTETRGGKFNVTVEERTLPQLRVYGPPEVLAQYYDNQT